MIPDENGFTVGEEVIPSPSFPSGIARDENGDVWVAWWYYFRPTQFRHTHTSATGSAPAISGAGGAPLLQWTLSEPAPGSYWAVLRSVAGGPYERITRVKAGAGLTMTHTDDAPVGPARYRIRRESVDERYQWLSEEVTWDGPTATALALESAEATAERVRLMWHGAGARLRPAGSG
jgi:hypothetical protein